MTALDWLALCADLAKQCEPLSAQERAEFESQIARVKAADERRRNPQPQLELVS